ncbi:MAG: hypothetical protein KGL39_05365, partial [Patescibacteria group bacterium]|nr:hypothetical protein [Patescibacteria group bacterium]
PASGYLPCVKQWGTQYLLISNRNTPNDYWAWDGSILYQAGTAAPNGVNIVSGGFGYSSNPTATAYGGFGSGMTLTPSVSGGKVVELQITNPGTGYEVGDVVQVQFSGGGANNSAVLQANLVSGVVSGATITAPGSGYTAATAAFSGGGGSGAAASVTIAGGQVTAITITNPGSGYTTAPGIVISGDGSGATAISVLGPGGVGSVTILNPGNGFTTVPLVSFVGGGGAGATGVVQLVATPISTVNITAGGSGYTSAPTVTFVNGSTAPLPFHNATATATVVAGQITAFNMTYVGAGYISTPTVVITPTSGGSGGVGNANVVGGQVTSISIGNAGSGYATAPTITLTGGNPPTSNAAAGIAVINGGVVTGVTITDAGLYSSAVEIQFSGGGGTGAGGYALFAPTSIASVIVSSTGQFYTSAPAAVLSAGANGSAYANVTLMPFGVSGSAMETYLSRVWIVDPAPGQFSTTPSGGNWSVSAPGSFTDFATSDGGVAALNTDAFLQTQYTNIHQSSGYLYFFGDGSVSVLSNVSTSGGTGGFVTTTYNYQNVDPQAGAQWRDTLQDFGRSSIVANSTGVYGLYGGSTSKISQKLDQLFETAIFPPAANAITPTSAIATIYNVKHYLLLMTVQDPDTLAYRNVMVTWNEKDWVITSQSVSLTSISTQKVGSKYFAYGSDGAHLYPLFSTPSSSLTKRLDTKQYGTDRMFLIKTAMTVHVQAEDNSAGLAGVSGTLSLVASGLALQNNFDPSVTGGVVNGTFRIQPSFQAPYPTWPLWGTSAGGIEFVTLSIRFSTTSPDFTLGNLVVGYRETTAFFGQ